MVPEVAAGQAGWPPPPHRNIMTPPATLVGAKCRWDTRRGDDRFENSIEKVMVLAISMRNVAEPAVLIGGVSFCPLSRAEKSSVAECAPGIAKRIAAIVSIVYMS